MFNNESIREVHITKYTLTPTDHTGTGDPFDGHNPNNLTLNITKFICKYHTTAILRTSLNLDPFIIPGWTNVQLAYIPEQLDKFDFEVGFRIFSMNDTKYLTMTISETNWLYVKTHGVGVSNSYTSWWSGFLVYTYDN